MSLPAAYLAKQLSRPLHTTDGGVLATIGDACRYMADLPKHRELRQAWQRACRLILDRAAPAEIMRQLSLALFMDAKLDLRRAGPQAAQRPGEEQARGASLTIALCLGPLLGVQRK
jgi:hypothetical protein